jgi:WD40 repeat protein
MHSSARRSAAGTPGSSVRVPDPQRSRVVLIGTSKYADAKLPNLPAVGRTIVGLTAVFTDPEYGVTSREHCTVLRDVGDIRLLGRQLRSATSGAEDLLLVYYAGHGLVGSRRHDLYLGLPNSEWDEPEFNSLEYDKMRSAVLNSEAAVKIIILDCCFSGRVVSDTMSDPVAELVGQMEVDGTYVLTSAQRDQVALILPGEQYTAFTGRFIQLLQQGVPGGPEYLTIDDLYRQLLRKMKAEGLPQPQKRSTSTADRLSLTRNRAFAATAQPALRERQAAAVALGERGDWSEAARLLLAVLAEQTRVLGPGHQDTLQTRRILAHALHSAGDLLEGVTLLRHLLADQTRLLGPDHQDTWQTRQLLSDLTAAPVTDATAHSPGGRQPRPDVPPAPAEPQGPTAQPERKAATWARPASAAMLAGLVISAVLAYFLLHGHNPPGPPPSGAKSPGHTSAASPGHTSAASPGHTSAASPGPSGTPVFGAPTASFSALDGDGILSVAFSRDGQFLAAGGRIGSTYLWNRSAPKRARTLSDPASGSSGAASALGVGFGPGHDTLAAVDTAGNVYLWSLSTYDRTALPTPRLGDAVGITCVAFSQDGSIVAAGDDIGKTYLYNLSTRRSMGAVQDPGGLGGVNGVAFNSAGTILATSDDNGNIYLWNPSTLARITVLAYPGSVQDVPMDDVGFSPDGNTLAADDRDGNIYLWNLSTHTHVTLLQGSGSTPTGNVLFSPNGKILAVLLDGNIDLWTMPNRREIPSLKDPGGGTGSLAFSPDSTILAEGSADDITYLWSIS